MPLSKTTLEVFVSPEEFKEVILDLESYPEFLPEVKKVEVLDRSEISIKATFWVAVDVGGVHVDSQYTVEYEIGDKEISWTLHSSPDLSENRGSWRLEEGDDEDETIARYEAEIITSLPIPEPVQLLFAEKELPKLMELFRDRAEG